MSEDRVGGRDELGNCLCKVFGVVLGIVCRWRDMVTLAVSAEVEEHAAILGKLTHHGPPDATMAAVAM